MKNIVLAHDETEIVMPKMEIDIPYFVTEVRKPVEQVNSRHAYLKGKRDQRKADLEAVAFGLLMLGLPFGMFLHWLLY